MYTGLAPRRVSWPVSSYKLRYIVCFALDEMVISANAKPAIYPHLYDITGAGFNVNDNFYFLKYQNIGSQ